MGYQYMPQLGLSTQKIKSENLTNIVQVRYEDWTENSDSYDTTTRMIFSHLLGSDHWAINELVERAKEADLNRKPDHGASMEHTSDTDVKHQASEILINLYADNVSCARFLATTDERMGYELPFMGSSATEAVQG